MYLKNADLAVSMEPGLHFQLVLKFHPPPSFLFHLPVLNLFCLLTGISISYLFFLSYLLQFMHTPRFHLAATRGQLECLNLMLGHNVDITAKDASGKFCLANTM